MIRSADRPRLTIVLLLATTSALLVAWVAEPTVIGGSWPLRVATVVVTFGVSLSFLIQLVQRSSQAEFQVKSQIDALCRLEPHDLANPDSILSDSTTTGPWSATYRHILESLVGLGRRVQEAEHQQAVAEARARRMSSELERTREILAGIPDPVIAVDAYGEIVLANPSAERAFGFQWQADLHPRLEQAIACAPLVEMVQEVQRRKSPSLRTVEFALATAGSQANWYRASCRNLATADHDATDALGLGAVAILTDVGHQKVAQKRNAEFVSAVSHEMKTPLTGIKAYVELLADGDAEDPETRDNFLDVIHGQTDRLQRLIDNLLNLARIEAGVVEVKKSARSLNEILTEALNVVRPAAEQKQVQLTSDLSPLYLGVFMDRDMLLQAAINLLSNAVKYTPAGGRVTVRSRSHDSDIVFDVEDTGVGLSEEDCQRVFEKFYRVKKDQAMAPGTGLGLPLAKHIVEDVHGGRLSVNSVLGKGSTFRVCLPSVSRFSQG